MIREVSHVCTSAGGSTIALPGLRPGELKMFEVV